jgi:hypothetical protein
MTQSISTSTPSSADLMAGFKENFAEIIDLVTEASEKKGPWVTDRIGKMSKKAQDEIWGRFNEAFNNGTKDAAAGRKFYKNSLDFPALAQKTTQVADDIELADKINKQFEENAPLKTIYGQYKQLSTSAKKEIEKHLKTTAEKTPPKDLQNALITVFDGMGRLDSEISRHALEAKLLEHAKLLQKDIDEANSSLSLLEQGIVHVPPDEDVMDVFKEYTGRLFDTLSPTAQFMIKQIASHLAGSADKVNASLLRDAIRYYFRNYKSWSSKSNSQRETLSKHWKLNESEVKDCYFHLQAVDDFSLLLPRYGSSERAAKDFEKRAKALLPNIDLSKYNV